MSSFNKIPLFIGLLAAMVMAEQIEASSAETQYVNRFKKMRNKKAVAEYTAAQEAIRDSIQAFTYHWGITFSGARTHEKRLGNHQLTSDWGGAFSMYGYYRHYFTSFFAMQWRLGMLYRYSSFKEETTLKNGVTVDGSDYDVLDRHVFNTSSFSVDAPLSLKLGRHFNHTSFLYFALTGDVTKAIYDNITDKHEYSVKDKDNVAPVTDKETFSGNFYADDWEASSWAGVGIDNKHFSVEYQLLMAAGSTKDNHRYHHMFNGGMPTWRLMIDFSLR